MEVIVGKLAGFCPGVSNAVKKTLEIAKQEDNIYCYGELVHNKQVVDELEKNGVITVEDITVIPNNSTVIFRAHGVKESTYEIAKQKRLKVIDLTCGNVKIIHDKVKKARSNSFIIIVGDKEHPENIGTKDFAGENSYVISSEDEIIDAYKEFEKSNLNRVYVVSQTTFNMKKFEDLTNEIEENFCEVPVIIDNTICRATELRQEEVFELSKKVDEMIVIGGKNSANTQKLVQISEKNCNKVYHIQTKADLQNVKFNTNVKIGIVAGASTPKDIILDVEKYIMEM
ncbi:MAG: 4-hydroxy-3-methylbut-2-enyl diphosphate reductase [Clostridia bacterium]|nr:4-hydroxy-3-methylbut-2-enyl diphosphate reductase [Clostridia bacterium]